MYAISLHGILVFHRHIPDRGPAAQHRPPPPHLCPQPPFHAPPRLSSHTPRPDPAGSAAGAARASFPFSPPPPARHNQASWPPLRRSALKPSIPLSSDCPRALPPVTLPLKRQCFWVSPMAESSSPAG